MIRKQGFAEQQRRLLAMRNVGTDPDSSGPSYGQAARNVDALDLYTRAKASGMRGFVAGKAHLRTGVPIFTHNNYSTGPEVPAEMALRQLDQFEAVGVTPESVALGHICCRDDPKADIAKRLAKRGAFVAFDRVTRQQQWVSDECRLTMILAFLDAGHIDKLLISSNYIGRINTGVGEVNGYPGPLHARDGGPGYARPLKLFVPLMRKAGIKDKDIRKITQDNPRRFLSFVPKEA